jgi:hypothetical protein
MQLCVTIMETTALLLVFVIPADQMIPFAPQIIFALMKKSAHPHNALLNSMLKTALCNLTEPKPTVTLTTPVFLPAMTQLKLAASLENIASRVGRQQQPHNRWICAELIVPPNLTAKMLTTKHFAI